MILATRKYFPACFPEPKTATEDGRNGSPATRKAKSAGVFFVSRIFRELGLRPEKNWDFKHANVAASVKLAYEKTGDTMDYDESRT